MQETKRGECVCGDHAAGNVKSPKWRLAVNFCASAENLESTIHAVEHVPSKGRSEPARFLPIRFIYTDKLSRDDRLLLAFDGLVLSEMLGREVSHGKIIHGHSHAKLNVKTSALAGEVRKHIADIAELLSNPSPPDLILIPHCTECEFQARCRQKALENNDLSLLSGMTAKERKKLHDKGIFTVTQLSYTFRPRRRPKRLQDKREKYNHSLRALAIRQKKIHLVGNPELRIEGTPVYLDLEGLPDRDFYYLIGVRLENHDTVDQYSLWADGVENEKRIWSEFLDILANTKDPVLIHYGSYETVFLKRSPSLRLAYCGTHGVESGQDISKFTLCHFCTSLLSHILKQPQGHWPLSWCEVEWPLIIRLPEPCVSSRMGAFAPFRFEGSPSDLQSGRLCCDRSSYFAIEPNHPRSEVESGCGVLVRTQKSRV
jgi:predicted RecB family nuclease